VDAAQLTAHRRIDIEGWGIDCLAFSAHKVYAPFGCGVLVVKKGLLDFDSSELKLIKSSGEENAGGIAALGKALVLMQRIGMDLIQDEEQHLTRRTLMGLSKISGLKMYGITDPDSAGFAHKIGVIVFSLKAKMSNKVAIELAERGGIGVRYGCHCAHIIIKHILHIGPLLEQFQGLILTLFPGLTLPGLVRVSLGIANSEEDVDTLIRVLGIIAGQPSFSGNNRHAYDTKTGIRKQMDDFVNTSVLRVYSQP
jgi:selenocysteine lyase/cysteine desulfurase